MGLMFARRRMEEAAKRAANKVKAQHERHKENKAKHGQKPGQPDAQVKDGKNGADSKGTK